jgi:hypothetical protein
MTNCKRMPNNCTLFSFRWVKILTVVYLDILYMISLLLGHQGIKQLSYTLLVVIE